MSRVQRLRQQSTRTTAPQEPRSDIYADIQTVSCTVSYTQESRLAEYLHIPVRPGNLGASAGHGGQALALTQSLHLQCPLRLHYTPYRCCFASRESSMWCRLRLGGLKARSSPYRAMHHKPTRNLVPKQNQISSKKLSGCTNSPNFRSKAPLIENCRIPDGGNHSPSPCWHAQRNTAAAFTINNHL